MIIPSWKIPNHIVEKIIPNLNEHQKDVKDRSVFRYGNPHYKDSLISQSYPQYLIDLTNYLINKDILKKKPISITINRYKVSDYISPHIDARKHDDIVTILNLENNFDFFLQKGSILNATSSRLTISTHVI